MYPIGFRKGRLLVIGNPEYKEFTSHRKSDGTPYKRKRAFYPCRCDCGNVKNVPESQFYDSRIQSCGCLKKEMYASKRRHNTSYHSRETPLYRTWSSMIRRCHSPKAANRKYYFSRGITVCQLWREDFSAFEKWAIDNGYRQGLQIDRIDVNGNYEPSNCRWITAKENSHNRRNNVVIEYKGKLRKLVDVVEETKSKIDVRTVYKRIFIHGWGIEKALSEPKHCQNRRPFDNLIYKGERVSTKELARMTGLDVTTIRNRLRKQGMTEEQVVTTPRKTHLSRGRKSE